MQPKRPVILDLFCGAGGAAQGYYDAGFSVIGVDHLPQKNYPFEFLLDDSIETLVDLLYNTFPDFTIQDIDAIHASPPCQLYSDLNGLNGARDYPDLIEPLQKLLFRTGLPYVIENVEGAPLCDPKLICGTERGLGVGDYRLRRHRLFETNWPFVSPGCGCSGDTRPIIDVSGGGQRLTPRKDKAGGETYKGTADEKRAAMGIDWMTREEVSEAVPPAYTELIGRQLLAILSPDA